MTRRKSPRDAVSRRVVDRLRWLRLATGDRITTCGRFWLVPHGRPCVWWLYMREHGGDLRITPWRLVYRSHKLQHVRVAASVCVRATTTDLARADPTTDPMMRVANLRYRVDATIACALDTGELARGCG